MRARSSEPRKTRHSENANTVLAGAASAEKLAANEVVATKAADELKTSGKAATSKPGYGELSLIPGAGVSVPPANEYAAVESKYKVPPGSKADEKPPVQYTDIKINSDGTSGVALGASTGAAHTRNVSSTSNTPTTQYAALKGEDKTSAHAHGGYTELAPQS